MDTSLNSDVMSPIPVNLNQRRCLNKHDWLELISNAAIPLMIGVISLWIAINQQNVTQTNRDKDAAQTAELRKQDIEIARLQRDEDKETARLQRAEDKETARLQREEDQRTSRLQREEDRDTARLQRAEDKENARLQRELELNMTNDQRIQDYALAENQRNISEQQRAREFEVAYKNRLNDLKLEDDYQKESALLEYQDDLATLLLDNGLLLRDPNSKWWFTLQMKTEAALRQLDPPHRTILIHTLLESKVLDIIIDYEQSILYKANLSGVEFGQSLDAIHENLCIRYDMLNAAEADVRYASFRGVCLYHSPYFAYSNLDYTDWSFSTLDNVHFENETSMNGVKFTGAVLTDVRFDKTIIMKQASFQYNIACSHCQFLKTSFLGARLDHSNFLQSTFLSLDMADVNMINGSFTASIFENVKLDRANLSGAILRACIFSSVSMINCSLSGAILNKTKFSRANLTGCTGLTQQQIAVISNLYETTLPDGTFIKGKQVTF
ncbi:unnamed protein product [Adineta steineri]|uniref:Pentapeptide repeat-containing protein n=1 Tax=Adineta steineri TaxID=433720 RepID=A0A815C7A0_9BILA|nr:unnamed protein product [Adineta steineri]CAF3958217.1 unnamed protein product [Adineta steineri]